MEVEEERHAHSVKEVTPAEKKARGPASYISKKNGGYCVQRKICGTSATLAVGLSEPQAQRLATKLKDVWKQHPNDKHSIMNGLRAVAKRHGIKLCGDKVPSYRTKDSDGWKVTKRINGQPVVFARRLGREKARLLSEKVIELAEEYPNSKTMLFKKLGPFANGLGIKLAKIRRR